MKLRGPSFRRNGIARLSRRALAIGLLASFVVVAMIASTILARQAADSHRRAQVLFEQLRASSQEMSALKWHANTEVLSGTANLSQSGALVSSGAAILKALDSEASQLKRLVPGADANRLEQDVQQLIAGSIDGLDAARVVTPQARAQLTAMQSQYQPILDRMDTDATRAASHQNAVASRALGSLEWVSIATLLLGLSVLALLAWRLSRVQRRSALEEERRALERRTELRVRALVEQSSDVVTVLGRDLRVRWQAASVRGLLGINPGSLVESPIGSVAHPDDQALLESFLFARLDGDGPATLRTRLMHADGRTVQVEIVAADHSASPAIGGLVLNMRDIGERIAFEDELRHQAFHDSLTGLANRALFENRLRHALASGLRTHRPLAVLFLDLDDFKMINDSLGHGIGDLLLQRVAARVDPLVRPSDTAARFGGDEFALLLDGVSSEQEALEVASRVLAALGSGFIVRNRQLTISASIGIALSDGSVGADELLRNADMAMYAAKANGKNSVRAFEPQMHHSAVERLELRTELPAAIEEEQLFLEYQPIVSLQDAHLVGAEALVRWQHPKRGRLAPVQFIGLAEETGQIVQLGRWVLERACERLREWHDLVENSPAPYISVNVSTRQLQDDDFPAFVAEVLERTGLDPHSLVLEITEGLLADDREAIVRRLHAFKRLGVRIAVDDFGTGYSALSHLQNFPIDILKIDKSFVDELHTSSQKASLVQGIINLGESLELDVVAEGIEQSAQADRLRAMRSPLGQGYLFSRPVPAEELLELLRGSRESVGDR